MTPCSRDGCPHWTLVDPHLCYYHAKVRDGHIVEFDWKGANLDDSLGGTDD